MKGSCPFSGCDCQHEECLWWADEAAYCTLLYCVLVASGVVKHTGRF